MTKIIKMKQIIYLLLTLAFLLVSGIANAAPPQIDSFIPASPVIVDEGTNTTFTIYFSDPDGNPLTVSIYYDGELIDPIASGVTVTQTYVTGDFYADFYTVGTHNATVIISDGTSEVFQEWDITVNDINTAPKITYPDPGTTVTFYEDLSSGYSIISAMDFDNDTITFTIDNLPEGATFYPSTGTGGLFNPLTATLLWTPTSDQRGEYQITLTASDGTLSSSVDITMIVNRPPVIENFDPLGEITMNEGEFLALEQDVTDADGNVILYSWLLDSIPISYNNFYTYNPDYNSAGSHTLEFIASDGHLDVNKIWTIVVNDATPPSSGGGGGGGGSGDVQGSAGFIIAAPETPAQSTPVSVEQPEETKNDVFTPETVQENPITGATIVDMIKSNSSVSAVILLLILVLIFVAVYLFKKR